MKASRLKVQYWLCRSENKIWGSCLTCRNHQNNQGASELSITNLQLVYNTATFLGLFYFYLFIFIFVANSGELLTYHLPYTDAQ